MPVQASSSPSVIDGTVIPLMPPSATGALVIANVPGGSSSGLPAGRGLSTGVTGLQVVSSNPSDDVNPGGIDGTGRILLYSYQRANASGFGETIRNFLMRWDAKANTAWYGPKDGYDGGGNPITTDGWTAWTWAGSHYEANDHGSIHGHYEIEVPDASLALQGRLIVPFIDDNPSSGTYGQVGLTKTNVRINQADFTMDSAWGVIRVGGSAGVNDRVFELASSIYSSNTGALRWRIVANNTAESGSNAGSDFAIRRFDDTGNLLGTALFVRRSDGQSSMGSASPLGARLTLVWGGNIHGYSAQPSSSPVTSAAYDAQMTATTDRAFQAQVSGDTNRRLVVTADGKMNLGPGNATQDTNLYRAAAGVLTTDTAFDAVHGLGVAQPREHTLVAWTFDPAHISSGKAGVAGTVYLAAVFVNRAASVTKIYWGINSAGSGYTSSQNFVGLFDSGGNLLQSAGVDSSSGVTGLITTSITSQPVTPGLYWVGFLFNASVMPQIYRGQDLNATLMNAGILTAASMRFATNGTSQTSLTSRTPSSNVAAQFCYWAAIT